MVGHSMAFHAQDVGTKSETALCGQSTRGIVGTFTAVPIIEQRGPNNKGPTCGQMPKNVRNLEGPRRSTWWQTFPQLGMGRKLKKLCMWAVWLLNNPCPLGGLQC